MQSLLSGTLRLRFAQIGMSASRSPFGGEGFDSYKAPTSATTMLTTFFAPSLSSLLLLPIPHPAMQPLNSNSQWDHDSSVAATKRRPLCARLFAEIGDDMHAAFQEFIGTTLFLTLAFGGVQASIAEVASADGSAGGAAGVSRIMYVALCFGFSLLVSAWLFFRVTGGLFNPNVSTALFLTGIIGPVRFVLYCVAQLVGGIAAAALVYALTPGEIVFK